MIWIVLLVVIIAGLKQLYKLETRLQVCTRRIDAKLEKLKEAEKKKLGGNENLDQSF